MKIKHYGNCTGGILVNHLRILTNDLEVTYGNVRNISVDVVKETLDNYDVILATTHIDEVLKAAPELKNCERIIKVPIVYFNGYTPDCVRARSGGTVINTKVGRLSSFISLYGYKKGLSVEETLRLYNEDVYNELGYFDIWNESVARLNQHFLSLGYDDITSLINIWARKGTFMHTLNHPRSYVIQDIAKMILKKLDIETIEIQDDRIEFYSDHLADVGVWPVYPEIASRLGLEGSYLFKSPDFPDSPSKLMPLEEIVADMYKNFQPYDKDELTCNIMPNEQIEALNLKPATLKSIPVSYEGTPKKKAKATNPYVGIGKYQMWNRAFKKVDYPKLDIVIESKFKISKADKVATAGSCFAQNISKTLQILGYQYYITELPPADYTKEQVAAHNYGVFTARYGNIYTVKQLIQLMHMAYGKFKPSETYWEEPDGTFRDPYRPTIEPKGFSSVEELEKSREVMYESVRKMFETLDVFVFTLGLTEAWRSKVDGAVFPVAPGVSGGSYDPEKHEFINFGDEEVARDLDRFIKELTAINTKAKVVLTVSPVPLAATYENRHVMVSTTYSKSVLRVVAEKICNKYDHVAYFPSYEIFSSAASKGAYYHDNLRDVKPEGVSHAMRLMAEHYFVEEVDDKVDKIDVGLVDFEIICDENAYSDI